MLKTAKQIKPPSLWASLRTRLFRHQAEPTRLFSEIDYYRLQGLVTGQHLASYASLAPQLQYLRRLINQGYLYPCKAVPDCLVTMNSEVLLRSCRGTGFRVTLVYPRDANRQEGKVSVLSPLGLALIGKIEGQAISAHMRIETILSQPERLGHYYT